MGPDSDKRTRRLWTPRAAHFEPRTHCSFQLLGDLSDATRRSLRAARPLQPRAISLFSHGREGGCEKDSEAVLSVWRPAPLQTSRRARFGRWREEIFGRASM